MGRGNYLGGGTIIGFGQRWSDWQDFSPSREIPKKRKKKQPPKNDDQPPPSYERLTIREANARAKKLPVTQYQILKYIKVSKKDMLLKNRGKLLKSLVHEGVLLISGLPNPDNRIVKEAIEFMKTKAS